MLVVGIRALKDRLSEYVRRAQAGETILVTDRDRVVAELNPPARGRAEDIGDAVLADMVRQGILTPPLIRTADPPPRAPSAPLEEILADLDWSREDR